MPARNCGSYSEQERLPESVGLTRTDDRPMAKRAYSITGGAGRDSDRVGVETRVAFRTGARLFQIMRLCPIPSTFKQCGQK